MATTEVTEKPVYSRKDFLSSSEPRWCSGCGDFFILQALSGTLASLGVPKENFLIISGIGCSSRFPYYLDAFGFHTIHGRAPTVALGAKLANPDLSVWVITGDGDGLSIGGNHLLHALRRNPDINIVLFNNEIYGLTKGQASPTSKVGLRTKSSPGGSIDKPVNPLALAATAGATFIGRVVDTNLAQMKDVFTQAYHHRGVSFIEAYTNCVIFNDGVFEPFEKRTQRADATVELGAGEPLLFGKNKDKGLSFTLDGPVVKEVDKDNIPDDIMVHHPESGSDTYCYMLSQMSYPELPIPVGVLRKIEAPVYSDEVRRVEQAFLEKKGPGNLDDLFRSGDLWEVN